MRNVFSIYVPKKDLYLIEWAKTMPERRRDGTKTKFCHPLSKVVLDALHQYKAIIEQIRSERTN